jgi:hypothetical protein
VEKIAIDRIFQADAIAWIALVVANAREKMVSGGDPPEIAKIWKLLLDSAEPTLRERPDSDVPLSSTYMLGVQSKNNEGMPMGDRARFFFLLHLLSLFRSIHTYSGKNTSNLDIDDLIFGKRPRGRIIGRLQRTRSSTVKEWNPIVLR